MFSFTRQRNPESPIAPPTEAALPQVDIDVPQGLLTATFANG